MSKTTRRNRTAKPAKFEHRLVLTNWMLSLFDVATFEDIAKHMRDPVFEGFNEDGISRFHQCLKLLFDRPELSQDMLLVYDENIVRHWRAITERRNADGQSLYPKYFQYLCLLFAEIYLDRYFRDPEALLNDLNAYADQFNAGDTLQQKALGQLLATGLPEAVQVRPFAPEDLRKLAFWSATGSGKTLLMHVNILQYRHYLALHGRERDLNRTILLTPNEGLSLQHLEELRLSGMDADLFDKDASGLFTGRGIEIIDVHKLRETTGEKTVAVDAFENNNLVLVDEGHRGTTGTEVGHWMRMRNRLCEKGFSFEYSATFGQAMKASGSKDLPHEYAKCILFDYSYKYFYGDGYGKEYRILNLEDDSNEDHRRHYLTACLLAFYQQQRLFADKRLELQRFLIERPLWIFVGGSVTKKPSKKDVSDVVDILLFLAGFVQNRDESVRYLDLLLRGCSGLHDAQGRELFAGAYTYLGQLGLSGEAAFRDILTKLFNADVPGTLHVRRLKTSEAEGEVSLHIGEDNEPFGVINVGDSSGLCKLCEEHPDELAVSDSEFGQSIFQRINESDSDINVLIGSKKFSEGWSSWRVSTMGLMNVGKNEGSQIIQLFGRGVRLKGYDFCLKRSRCILGLHAPPDIERLETLNVFGVHADYMRQFKEYLEDEGLPSNEDRIEFVLPVVKNLGNAPLKTIRLKEGVDFKKQGPKPTLDAPDEYIKKNRIVVDWYPRIQALASLRGQDMPGTQAPNECWFTPNHVAFLDLDNLYFDLQRLKSERAWYNLNLDKDSIPDLLTDPDWYVIYVPSEEMKARSFEQVRRWQEIAATLLRKYCDRYYKRCKADFEKDHLEYRPLTEDDSNFIDDYQFLIDQSRKDIVTKLEEVKHVIESGQLRPMDMFHGLHPLFFGQHLYQPLVYVDSDLIEVKPVPLNGGERDFVLDLQNFCTQERGFFQGKELYLLRNMSRGRGIGFFESGNFYPDFILWLLADGRQYINFVDPKGLRNLRGADDPKIAFYRTIKSIESDLRAQDPAVTLNSFIVSNTRLPEVSWWSGGMTKEQFEQQHVFFQQEDKATYIGKMLAMIRSTKI
jgi:hypothetical protein